MVGAFATQISLGQPVQFVVDKRHEPLQRLAVAVTPMLQKLCDVVGQILSVAISTCGNFHPQVQISFENSCRAGNYVPVGAFPGSNGRRISEMEKKRTSVTDTAPGAYRRILLERRESVLHSLGTKAGALVNGERVSEEDQAQHSLAEAVSLRLNGYEYLQLRQIQEALDRLQLGEFGMCLSCDQPIAPKRLRAVPWAKYCVKCQEMIADRPIDGHDPLDD
jgi:DnaK suppressor protein